MDRRDLLEQGVAVLVAEAEEVGGRGEEGVGELAPVPFREDGAHLVVADAHRRLEDVVGLGHQLELDALDGLRDQVARDIVAGGDPALHIHEWLPFRA
jgi:hypothetical protein